MTFREKLTEKNYKISYLIYRIFTEYLQIVQYIKYYVCVVVPYMNVRLLSHFLKQISGQFIPL